MVGVLVSEWVILIELGMCVNCGSGIVIVWLSRLLVRILLCLLKKV